MKDKEALDKIRWMLRVETPGASNEDVVMAVYNLKYAAASRSADAVGDEKMSRDLFNQLVTAGEELGLEIAQLKDKLRELEVRNGRLEMELSDAQSIACTYKEASKTMLGHVYNPNGAEVDSLPWIYGFCNGGSANCLEGLIVAEDGTFLGHHVCSSESWMARDLNIMEGGNPNRDEKFRNHYPNGYRTEFIAHDDLSSHAGLNRALERAHAKEERMRFD